MEQRRMVATLAITGLVLFVSFGFWQLCIVPLKNPVVEERRQAVSGKERAIDREKISLILDNWKTKVERGVVVQPRERIVPHKAVVIRPVIRQENAVPVNIRYVRLTFSTNTLISSGSLNGSEWEETGRRDAHEYRYFINQGIPPFSEVELPGLNVEFKMAGLYELSYCIIIEGDEASEGRCEIKVSEN